MKPFSKNHLLVLTAIIFCAFQGTLLAQEKIKFGKIDISDLKMTRCPFDSAADALVLCDVGSSRYEYSENKGFELLFDRLVRIKIFTKTGYPNANFTIEYWNAGTDCEKVESLKGKTYNLESGGVAETKLDDKSIFDEVEDIHTKVKKISFPAVREGSVVELKYTIRSPFIGHIRSWYFQGELPIRWSEYEVNVPEYFRFGKQSMGYYPFEVNKTTSHPETINSQYFSYNGTMGGVNLKTKLEHSSISYQVYTEQYATRDVPALKEEPFSNTLQNYSMRIRYELKSYQYPGRDPHELTTDWRVVVRDLEADEDFGKQLNKSGLVKDIVDEINGKALKPYYKMVEAQNYVRTHFKWNGKNSLYPSENLKKAVANHAGNSADLNLLLILILRELNLNVVPLASSTWDNGVIFESVPTQRGLNYVTGLVRLDSSEYILDATSPYLPFKMVPRRCLNDKGVVVSDGNTRWVPLLGGEKDNSLTFADLKIDTAGNLQGRMITSESGYSAADSRENYFSSGEAAFSKTLKEKYKLWDVGEIKYENAGDPEKEFKVIFDMIPSEIGQSSGNMIYLNVLSGLGKNSNPFNNEKRIYPVDFNCPVKETYVFTYEIPPGFNVESLPESVKFSLPDQSASFKFVVGSKENKIMVSSMLTINKTTFITSEYEALRDFFARIVAKHSQQIVLKKS